jgi:hypothetical protein
MKYGEKIGTWRAGKNSAHRVRIKKMLQSGAKKSARNGYCHKHFLYNFGLLNRLKWPRLARKLALRSPKNANFGSFCQFLARSLRLHFQLGRVRFGKNATPSSGKATSRLKNLLGTTTGIAPAGPDFLPATLISALAAV